MMCLRFALGAAALGIVLTLGACETTGGPPPVLTLGPRTCTDSPDLTRAVAVTYVPDDPKPVTLTLDATAPCVRTAGGVASVYAVFALPDTGDVHVVSIASTPVGGGLFPPFAQFLDASGTSIRAVPASAFLFRGGNLTAQVRSHPGEKYLLVQSVPELIGKELSRTQARTSAYGAAAGGAYFMIYTGSDVTSNFVYSLNGQLTIELRPIPKG